MVFYAQSARAVVSGRINKGISVPGVHFLHWDASLSSNVLNSLASFRDDAHTLGDGLGCDWVVASHHDNLQPIKQVVTRDKCDVDCTVNSLQLSPK